MTGRPPTTPTTPPTTTPTTPPTTTPTTPPTTAPPAGRTCSAGLAITGSWSGGFQGEVTVTAGSSAIGGWAVTWQLASGQSITQSWGADVSTSGSAVTARNVSWNGSLGAGAKTTFGFLGGGAPAAATLACAAS